MLHLQLFTQRAHLTRLRPKPGMAYRPRRRDACFVGRQGDSQAVSLFSDSLRHALRWRMPDIIHPYRIGARARQICRSRVARCLECVSECVSEYACEHLSGRFSRNFSGRGLTWRGLTCFSARFLCHSLPLHSLRLLRRFLRRSLRVRPVLYPLLATCAGRFASFLFRSHCPHSARSSFCAS